ncbi:MAG: response regulator transcription factor [Candidatus Eremiobacterota bacterium]
MIKILIVDDHPVVRKGLKQIMEETKNITVVDEAETGQEVLKKVKKNKYDVVLLDISLPDMNGLEVLRALKSEYPEINVLMLSIYPEEQYAMRALRGGASGYLTKEKLPDELVLAIKTVTQGRKYITPSVAELLAINIEKDRIGLPHEVLSDREFRIMCMMASGKTASDIADELSLSVKTVSTYRYRILKKMKMKNNAEIIRYVIEQKLIDVRG